MLLSSTMHQYLHPDYLQPLPTMLDAKKSPLALLAQTCSSIGKDSASTVPSSKSIIPPIEKKPARAGTPPTSKSSAPATGRVSSSPTRSTREENASPTMSADMDVKRELPGSRPPTPRSESPSSCRAGFRAPSAKEIPPLVPIGSPRDEDKPTAASPAETTRPRSRTSDRGTPATSSSSKISLSCGNMYLEVNHQESSPTTHGLTRPPPPPSHTQHIPGLSPSSSSSSASSLKLDSAAPAMSLAPTYPGCHGLPLMGHSMDPAANPLYPTALSAHHLLGMSSQRAGCVSPSAVGHHGVTSPSLSPYMTYARVKTASGATTLVPVCKDPYCSHCQLTAHGAQMSGCGAGCAQCGHDKSLGLVPSHPGAPSSAYASALSSHLYPHGFGSLSAAVSHHGSSPYVCNWMSGNDYCGKRFTSSEELWQHLRTHTSAADSASALSGLPYPPGLGLSGSAAAAAAAAAATAALGGCHSHYSPNSLSPGALRLNYPRTLSPNSSLLAASRYHPYKSAMALGSLPGLPSALLPGVPPSLGAYYSPYSLYTQRLGATVTP